MLKILHIAAHMGGGIGKFLSETLVFETQNHSDYIHKILLIEKPEKSQFVDICISKDIHVGQINEDTSMRDEMNQADIVVVHWWHNPAMAQFLSVFPQIATRLVVWVHISGCSYPALPFQFASLPHKIFFTTEYSYENPFWNREERKRIETNSAVIYGLGVSAVDDKPVKVNTHNEFFTIGYVGTLSDSKIHPNFAMYCKETLALIPHAKFILLGDLTGSEQLIKQLNELRIRNRFEFVGYTNHVDQYLEGFDVFGYPLNPYHFGTTENVVIEAMSKGLPVVMLNQCTEKYIVTHMHDGLLANTPEEYAAHIKYLHDNPNQRIRLGENAKQTIKSKYDMAKNVDKMHEQFSELVCQPKKTYHFESIFGRKPYEWFLTCLGEDQSLFLKSLGEENDNEVQRKISYCKPILKGKGKSSIEQFAAKFPADENLQYWKSLIQKTEVQ